MALPCDRKSDQLGHTCKAGVLSLRPYPAPWQLKKDKRKTRMSAKSLVRYDALGKKEIGNLPTPRGLM